MRRLTLLVAAVLLIGTRGRRGGRSRQRWTPTGTTSLPLVYWQGVTVDPQGNLYFDGVFRASTAPTRHCRRPAARTT